jgi:hypothetical protein
MATRKVKDTVTVRPPARAGPVLPAQKPLSSGKSPVVAFRDVWKREVALGAGVRRAGATPRIVTRTPGSGGCLVDDGPDYRWHGLRLWNATPQEHQGAASTFHIRRGMYILAQSKAMVGPYYASCLKRRRSQMFARVALLLAGLAAAADGALSRSSRSWCCNRSTAATSFSTLHHEFSVELDQRGTR